MVKFGKFDIYKYHAAVSARLIEFCAGIVNNFTFILLPA